MMYAALMEIGKTDLANDLEKRVREYKQFEKQTIGK